VTDVVNHLMDAQAHNAAQARALFNPSPEIDSALEHAMYLLRTSSAQQRPHARALVSHLRDVHRLNEAERKSEREAAAIADGTFGPVTSVHEFSRLARPILADLLNPVMPQRKLAARLGELHELFGRTLPRTREAFSCRPLLGVRKYTRLVDELQAWGELRGVSAKVSL
jgi:hypothetical protein